MNKLIKTNPKKRIVIELIILLLLFLISIYLPYISIYDIETNKVKSEQLGYENIESIYFGILLLITSLSLLSYNKIIIYCINPVVIISTLVISILTIWSMALCGITGSVSYGFLFSLIIIWTLVYRSYYWSQSLSLIKVKVGHSKKILVIILSIPLILFVLYTLKEEQPQWISSSAYETEGKNIKSYSYSWEGKNVEFTKYYTIHKNKKPSKVKYTEILDSINMTFYNNDNEAIKEITKKAHRGNLDLKEFF